MICIDINDARPIYEQVAERFKLLILRGAIASDEKIPSVRNLAVELSLNPNTIQRAYMELEKQGYIYTIKGRGNFVSDSETLRPQFRTEILRQLSELCDMATLAGITREELIEAIREWRNL